MVIASERISVDIETKILTDLDEKIHGITGTNKIVSNMERD